MGKKNSHTGHRSSKTGRFVTERYAQQHSRGVGLVWQT